MARHRTQLLLEPDQHRSLSELAQAHHRSMSDLVRELVAAGIARHRANQARRLAVLEQLAALRQRIEARTGLIPRDLVAEVRAEREREVEASLSPVEAQ